jgi:hypothetical protein
MRSTTTTRVDFFSSGAVVIFASVLACPGDSAAIASSARGKRL